MRRRSPYRFNRPVLIIFTLVLSFIFTNSLQAQDEYDSTVVEIAPPVEDYNADDEYSNKNEVLPPELRQVSDSTVNRLKSDKDFEYANDDAYLEKPKPAAQRSSSGNRSYKFFDNRAVKAILYTLLIGFFIFVIYRIIVVNNLFLFSRKKTLRTDGEVAEEEITEENVDDRIRKAINDKDYRSAVRYLYLKGLHLLSDKGWIRYHAQATNHDYVYQVSKYPVAGDFRFLTKVYDYVWYGEFAVNDEQFTRLQSDFQRFYQALRK